MVDDLDIDSVDTKQVTELAVDTEMTIQELYEALILKEDIIITIAESDHEDIKRALTGLKAKENTKLKDKGMPVDTAKLQFLKLEDKTKDVPLGAVRLQISLVKRRTFAIQKIETPEPF
jgi:hypothetical protein